MKTAGSVTTVIAETLAGNYICQIGRFGGTPPILNPPII